jgi:lariat debranching enzyme
MDRLTLTSSILFVIADIFAVISVSLPEWIVSEVGGLYI